MQTYGREGRKKYFAIVNFSERFRDLTDGSGRTQRELADGMGISEASLVNYRRDRTPKAEELLRIARYFSVTIEWLLTGDDDRQPKTPDGWKQRAIAAEAKVEMLKSGMEGLLKKI
jgi:transcriptional regulator with XRE-family HTH domain